MNEGEIHQGTLVLSPKAEFAMGLANLCPPGSRVTNIASKSKNNYCLKAQLTQDMCSFILWQSQVIFKCTAFAGVVERNVTVKPVSFCDSGDRALVEKQHVTSQS